MAGQKGLDLHIDSCGLGWAHLGERCDPRSFEVAKKHGILIDHKAQQFQDHFFDEFDLILAVEEDIVEQLKMRSKEHSDKIRLASAFSEKHKGQSIPDPYYMGGSGFDDVFDMIHDCCSGGIKAVELR